MFKRFTTPARRVVVFAQEDARALGHAQAGTEHLLLGLLREEDGLAARILASLGVGLEHVRERVVGIVGLGEESPAGQIPFSPRAKKVLELALREADSLDHQWIGTEHLLLGLVRENEGVAAQILLEQGLDLEAISANVVRTLGGTPPLAELEARQPSLEAAPDQLGLRWPITLGAAAWALALVALALGVLIGWAIWH